MKKEERRIKNLELNTMPSLIDLQVFTSKFLILRSSFFIHFFRLSLSPLLPFSPSPFLPFSLSPLLPFSLSPRRGVSRRGRHDFKV